MKYFLPSLFCLFIVFAGKSQTADTAFSKQWHAIDSIITIKDLPKTALKKVDKIYEDAKRNGLDAQVIKALLYKVGLQGKTMEKDINGIVTDWNKEIALTKNIVQQSILYVLQAEALKNEYNNNRWNLYQRSKTTNLKKADIKTWGADDFYTAISALYTKALTPAALLQQTKLAQYDAIIIKGNVPELRPTLYDLLAHIALDYYGTDNENQTEAENAFALNDAAALLPAGDFIKYKFVTGDTSSRLLKALQLYQTLIQFHAAHNDTAASIDIDINRLTWVHDNAAFTNKDDYYKAALTAITQQYANHPQAAQAWYLQVNMIADKAKTYNSFTDTTHRYDYVTVRQMILERLKAQPAPSEGNGNMQRLLREIDAKELHTEAESVNVPGQPFRLLVQYKNVDTLYGRIIAKKLVDGLHITQPTDFWQQVSTLPFTRSFAQPLPVTNDYQQHKVEIKMDAMPAGEFVLLGSRSKRFDDSTGGLLTQDITISHLSYIHKGNDYFVLDRETGRPLNGIKAIITVHYYTSGRQDKVLPAITTNQQGYFTIGNFDKDMRYLDMSIKLMDGKDILDNTSSEDYISSADNNGNVIVNSEKKNAIIHFYTDRAIYRPGQKVFFKGIAITSDAVTHKPKLYIPADSIKVYLKDINNKNIDTVSVKINEYGSITGSFTLPAHALTGRFSITVKDINGWQGFNVEEYKRPTYYVQLDTLKSAYRLKDTITVTGFAQAFAGNFLNNAQVKYNVQRGTRYNIYEYGFRRYPQNNNNKQIAEGVITTGGSGRFTIKFPALPDETVDTATNPIFDFTINATVTDAGGETRDANTSLSVGYTSLAVKLNVPAVVEKTDLTKIPVSVENLSGKPVDANVHINIYPLQPPGRAARKRYWDRPDMFVMSKTEFVRNFPYDEYENESDPHTWQKDKAIINDTFNTSNNAAYSLKHAALAQGWYVVEAVTSDKDGHDVKDMAYVEVYDAAASTAPAFDDNFSTVPKTVLHPGDKATLIIGSGFNDVYVLEQMDKMGGKNEMPGNPQGFHFYGFSNSIRQIEEPVTENDRGGFGMYYVFVKHNRFYTGGSTFIVPYDNKELNVKYTTYRNKTEPGSKEKWTVQVTGNDSTKKGAELLTAMYDASLDAFATNEWYAPNMWPTYNGGNNWQSGSGFGSAGSDENGLDETDLESFDANYDRLATKGDELWNQIILEQLNLDSAAVMATNQEGIGSDVAEPPKIEIKRFTPPRIVKEEVNNVYFNELNAPKAQYRRGYAREYVSDSSKVFLSNMTNFEVDDMNFYRGNQFQKGVIRGGSWKDVGYFLGGDFNITNNIPLQIRKNFNETAFFFPQLYPDSTGNYTIRFTMPESLTKWKWISLAHTKDLSFGANEQTIITQKTLMVQPSVPRFLREGDNLELTARISNLGDTALTGQVELQLFDAQTNNPVDGLFQNVFPNQYFTSEAGQTSVVKFPVVIPFNCNKPLTYRIVAKTAGFNDGEENTLPVLTNRMLVTESLPLYIKGDTTKHFTFDKLLNNNSETLQTQSFTVEYTANPIWNAVQALPYLIEYPYECSEQTFNRFYANALAAFIIQQHPRIKDVMKKWAADSSSLTGNLDKNQELKQVLLEETPWVLDAENETQQKKNIALLFDIVKMSDGAQAALQKLQDMQLSDGSFTWFKGGYADRYITQYILTGIGRLQELHAVPAQNSKQLNAIITKALVYLDNEANNDYAELVKDKVDLTKNNLSYSAIQYLYMRSYFATVANSNTKAYNYFYQQAMRYWQGQSLYMKGMIAMTLLRTNQQAFVMREIYPAIIENAVTTPEKGMYWKDNEWGYYWYQSPIEQQALLIELAEIVKKQTDADEMKTWLINQKQTTNWKTTKATADACYALLLHSDKQLDADRKVTINLGGYTISSGDVETVAGTGYFKKVIEADKVLPAMGNVTVSVQTPGSAVKNTSPSYGAVYWQYLEDMDKITQATTSLTLHKKLFVERNTAAGKVLTPVNNDSVLHTGDKVIVRIELTTDRNLEYIHLKDMRAASMEPVNVLSEYKWQDGLGYYESTKDVATDFFISYMPKGTYVFEYPVYITHVGTFSTGIATVQCMYAPEFSSHSEGGKIVVE